MKSNNRHTQYSHLPTSLQLTYFFFFFFFTAKEHLEAEMDKPKHIVSFERKHNLTIPAQISSSRGTVAFKSVLVNTRCSLSVWPDEDPCCVILK